MTKSVAIIIPTLNEKKNILDIIEAFKKAAEGVEIVIADSSADGTDELVRKNYQNDSTVALIKCGKRGRGGAVKKGYEWVIENSDADLIAVADADGSHDPKELPKLLNKTTEADLVIGSRYLKTSKIIGWPWYRHVFSRVANLSAKLVLKAGVSDYTNGYRVFRRKLIEQLNLSELDADGYIMLSQELYQVVRLAGRIAEVPTTFLNRQRGQSNFHLGLIMESGMIMWRLWRAMNKTQQSSGKIRQDHKE